jgi:hypothetical protein
MKSSMPGYLLAASLGAVVGWGIATFRRPAEVLPAPKPAARVAPETPSPAPEPERPRPATTELPPVAAPAPNATPALPLPPQDWLRQIRSLPRVKDLLSTEPPPGDTSTKRSCLYARDQRVRDVLKSEGGQAAFLADLPTLSPKEMVALWDALWLNDREKAQGLGAYGASFARELSRSLVELIPAQADPSLRMLEANTLLQDTRYLSDAEVEYLRAFFQASSDPALQRRAQDLPRRGAR